MNWLWYVLIAAAGYILGNFSSGMMVARIFGISDIRDHGSGNPGTTNVMRTLGIGPALLTFAGDVLKAVVATFVGIGLMGELGGMVGGLCCILGHNWPAFMHFKGGKGMACSFGVVLVLNPVMALVMFIVQLLVLFITKYMSMASIFSMITYTVLTIIYNPTDWYRMGFAIIMCCLAVYCHRSNVKRLLAGNENKIDFTKLPHIRKK